ncbi:Protein of unknown function [Neorhodopirellula lusitana]|uniref:Right handed beta helix domain-containing protein n=2 Tax=Neorhodopirellula lusitana TaxID=445327 RepID=A0ABY1QD47_9BACT|nr:Protein of unknown function [Neorhodopirellula lusitana]
MQPFHLSAKRTFLRSTSRPLVGRSQVTRRLAVLCLLSLSAPMSCLTTLAFLTNTLLANTTMADTFVVSTLGDDQATGTAEQPFRTISHAAELAMPGDTIVVREGVYRERVSPPRGGVPGKPITYRGEKWGKVIIKGSDQWNPNWVQLSDSVHYAVPDESMFTDDVYLEDPNPFRIELASTPYNRQGKPEKERFGYGNPELIYNCGQVIVNGELYTQAPLFDEVKQQPRSWHFAPESGRIYVNFGDQTPAKQNVEITTRQRIFAPHQLGLGYIHVEGFVMEHCGNNYPTNFWNTPKWAQAGALGLRGGHHWLVRNNMIRHANTVAIDIGFRGGDNEVVTQPSVKPASPANQPESTSEDLSGNDNRIEANYFVDNGAAGLIGSGSLRIVISDNVIMRNNTLGFIGNKRYEHAGIKCHGIRDGLIAGNYIADNPSNDGIWMDNQFPGTRITRNVVINNGVKGIFLEMSDQGWDSAFVDHNVAIGNKLHQFYVHDASGSTVMHNLFANSPVNKQKGQGAYIYQVTARTRTYQHSLFNNLFIRHNAMMDINYPSHRSGPQRLDHNVYDAAPDQHVFRINSASDKPSPWSPADFIKMVDHDLGRSSTGTDSIDGGPKANLTFEQWQAFWLSHDLPNDAHSVLKQGMVVAYNPESQKLTLTVPDSLANVGSTDRTSIDQDFFHHPLPNNGRALPGPFQSLKTGINHYSLWKGLPILGPGSLPGSPAPIER